MHTTSWTGYSLIHQGKEICLYTLCIAYLHTLTGLIKAAERRNHAGAYKLITWALQVHSVERWQYIQSNPNHRGVQQTSTSLPSSWTTTLDVPLRVTSSNPASKFSFKLLKAGGLDHYGLLTFSPLFLALLPWTGWTEHNFICINKETTQVIVEPVHTHIRSWG
jgi:hypothetical protein